MISVGNDKLVESMDHYETKMKSDSEKAIVAVKKIRVNHIVNNVLIN